jgi:RNase H-fold protein (predicted Holliday junction resolvase)
MLPGMSKAFIWVTSTLGGLGKTSLTAALWRLSEQGVLPQCEVLDLDSSPRLGIALGTRNDEWRSTTERVGALFQAMGESTADVVIVNFPASSTDLLRALPEEKYLRRLAKMQQGIAQLHLVDPSMITNEVELAFNEANPLYASATAHFAVVPEHRMGKHSALKQPFLWQDYVDTTLTYPSWGITQPSEVMSAALEGRGEQDELVDLMLKIWLTTVAKNFDPLITWLNDAKPDGKEALHER